MSLDGAAPDDVQERRRLACRIIVKNEEGGTLLEIPVTVGLVGAVVAPLIAAVAVIGAMVQGLTFVVERVDERAA